MQLDPNSPYLADASGYRGHADELLLPGKYQEIVGDRVPVRIIDGIDHMGIVGNPAAVSVIADDVATTGLNS